MTTKKKRPHWYKMYIGECPVCGRDQSIRERQYTKRPKLRKNRVVYLSDSQTYDNCIRI